VKTRGRPRSDAIQDAKIASAVHTLSLWGFPLRAEVFEAVAKAARQELARGDHAGFSLGPDRIEQIYKGWLSEQRKLRSFERFLETGKIADVNPIFPERRRYTKDSLARMRPRGSVLTLACKLLRGKGPRRGAVVQLELAPCAESEYLAFRHAVGRGKTG
jgi:hypothetical protein